MFHPWWSVTFIFVMPVENHCMGRMWALWHTYSTQREREDMPEQGAVAKILLDKVFPVLMACGLFSMNLTLMASQVRGRVVCCAVWQAVWCGSVWP